MLLPGSKPFITQLIPSKSGDLGKANLLDGIGNLFTGNLDYQRQVALAERAEATSAREAALARKHSSEEAQKLREWQERMSNTAYSRAVKDLKSVGINPYAIGSFNAASVPSGAYGQAYAGSGFTSGTNSTAGPLASLLHSAIDATSYMARKGSGDFSKLLSIIKALK